MCEKTLCRLLLRVFAVGFVLFSLFYNVKADAEVPMVREHCDYEVPEDQVFDADFIAVRRALKVDKKEKFRVKVFMRNTGNMPWFNGESTCSGPHMSLGTENNRDSGSFFYSNDPEDNWEGANRVGMDQLRIDPGEIASFTFYGDSGKKDDVRKQYFAPVVEGITWIDDAKFSYDVVIGDHEVTPSELRRKMLFAGFSGSVLNLDLNGGKKVLVDLSDQRMQLLIGNYLVREFPVSTGKASTPTPVGETYVMLKQEVRVGGAAPHYIMPKFQMFRAGGYGLHALPSLSFDNGYFWTEARNHIGIPVSHGCIRLLPEDADFAFEFTDVGTPVVVQR